MGEVIDITKGEWHGCPHEDGGDGTCRYCDATWDPAERDRLVAELERVLADREATAADSGDGGWTDPTYSPGLLAMGVPQPKPAARCPGCGRPPGECGPACPAARHTEGDDRG